jgi:hypothetical protein
MHKYYTQNSVVAGSWVLGYSHHIGPEAVVISNRNNKNRKEDDLGKRKRAHKKSKKFEDDVKQVLAESSPNEWKTQEDYRVDNIKVMVRRFH